MTTDTDALTAILHDRMNRCGGRISFADFMSLALAHPQYGYYCRDTFELGERGDFTTASQHSPLFAQCFARQCEEIMRQMPEADILELGAGTGRFAGDLLQCLMQKKITPRYYYIYEVSPALRKKQHALMQSQYPALLDRIIWLDALPKDFCGIIIANEVLDALPVHCFRIVQGAIRERSVAFEKDRFTWLLHAPTTPALAEAVQHLQAQYVFPDGYASEINLGLSQFMHALSGTLTKGVILISDYGYGQSEYYHPARNRGTLTCFYQHRSHEDPLILPGQQDITAHVDFSRVLVSAIEAGFELSGYNTQAMFLLGCDLTAILSEAEATLSMHEAFELHQAVKMLTLPTEMGERVKVMALHKHMPMSLRGFSMQDLRRMLYTD